MAPLSRSLNAFILVALCMVSAAGCGYGFRSRSNSWENDGIRTIYIAPFTNNSLRPGVESTFTSALIREFSQGGRVKLASHREEADAILNSTVISVEAMPLSPTTADQVSKDLPEGQGLDSTFVIATQYTATAQINVHLSDLRTGNTLWSQGFSRSRVFPAANQGGDIGNTGVLINDSRYSMALAEIAGFLAIEVHDLFFERF